MKYIQVLLIILLTISFSKVSLLKGTSPGYQCQYSSLNQLDPEACVFLDTFNPSSIDGHTVTFMITESYPLSYIFYRGIGVYNKRMDFNENTDSFYSYGTDSHPSLFLNNNSIVRIKGSNHQFLNNSDNTANISVRNESILEIDGKNHKFIGKTNDIDNFEIYNAAVYINGSNHQLKGKYAMYLQEGSLVHIGANSSNIVFEGSFLVRGSSLGTFPSEDNYARIDISGNNHRFLINNQYNVFSVSRGGIVNILGTGHIFSLDFNIDNTGRAYVIGSDHTFEAAISILGGGILEIEGDNLAFQGKILMSDSDTLVTIDGTGHTFKVSDNARSVMLDLNDNA